jgi:hypothetical protein
LLSPQSIIVQAKNADAVSKSSSSIITTREWGEELLVLAAAGEKAEMRNKVTKGVTRRTLLFVIVLLLQ